MSKTFDEQADAAWTWWDRLQPHDRNGRSVPGDRAAVARLKRASRILDAAAEPATAALFQMLGFARYAADRDLWRSALVAAVLAHVRKDDKSHGVAAAIGAPHGVAEATALVSPLRFKRLVAAREPDELLIAFRRTVAQLGNTANVKDLARQLLLFTSDHHGDIARTRFAFAYHGAASFAPEAPAT
ncbi:MAG: type I-E CRISPR-associated protein Cse2/CasB [Hyphomicrobium sp.]